MKKINLPWLVITISSSFGLTLSVAPAQTWTQQSNAPGLL